MLSKEEKITGFFKEATAIPPDMADETERAGKPSNFGGVYSV